MGSGKIPSFQNRFPCYAARCSLFVGIGNFAEIADITISLGCPSRESYPRVAMMQSGQDRCGDDGP